VKRIAIVTAVIALLLLIDGTYLQVTNNQVGGDSGILFGDANIFVSAGAVVLFSGGLMLLGAVLMWVVALRRQGRLADGVQASTASSASSAKPASQPQGGAQAKVAAAQAQTGKEEEHQRQP
jgi:hypothetical protein